MPKISNVTDVVIKIVNFIRARALSPDSLLDFCRITAAYATIQPSYGLALAKY